MILTTGFNRSNLFFQTERPSDKWKALLFHMNRFRGQSGVIYCLTRKTVEEVCEKLVQAGYPATRYHAGLTPEERKENQDAFIYDEKPIMVATNAFGMGIDKSNVRYVIHYNMPKNMEGYYQEAGRAGRDGAPARCILLYSPQDVAVNRYFIDHNNRNEELDEEEQEFIRKLDEKRLHQMVLYSLTQKCLRTYILNYFGEKGAVSCGGCSNCLAAEEKKQVVSVPKKTYENKADAEKDLFDALRTLRLDIARKKKIPPYQIFSDSTLRDMCKIMPKNKMDFMSVPGVGFMKCSRYGTDFMKVIDAYRYDSK